MAMFSAERMPLPLFLCLGLVVTVEAGLRAREENPNPREDDAHFCRKTSSTNVTTVQRLMLKREFLRCYRVGSWREFDMSQSVAGIPFTRSKTQMRESECDEQCQRNDTLSRYVVLSGKERMYKRLLLKAKKNDETEQRLARR